MWNMYSSLEHGVRISLPYIPFESNPDASSIGSRILVVSRTNEGRFIVNILSPGKEVPCIGTLSAFPISYTSSIDLLKPKMQNDEIGRLYLDRTKIGRYKNLQWEFQQEWRYLIDATHWIEFKTGNPGEEMVEHIERIKHGKSLGLPDYIDLTVASDALTQLEVTLSPKMSLGNRLLASSLFAHYPFVTQVPSELDGLL